MYCLEIDKRMEKKLVYVGFAYKHHKGTHAGYQHIKDCLKYDHLIECQKEFEFLFFDVKEASVFKRLLRKLYAVTFGDGCPFALFRALVYSWKHPETVCFHIIYGDNIYAKFFYKLRRKNHKVVATVHQPFDNYMRSQKMKNKLLWPDEVIILSNNELQQFNDFTGKDNISYIPHGICTDFYKPLNKKTSYKESVLMVGNWLRDFDLAETVFTKLHAEHPEILIDMVGSVINRERFANLVNYHCGISDEELLHLYQNCSLVYLPLLRFTANNALLEAAATGCKLVIATDNTDDNTYIPKDFIVISKRTVDDSIEAILKNIYSKDSNLSLRKYIIERFSWEVVAEEVRKLLQKRL